MAEYNISARLTLKDQMTAQLKSAASAAEKLTRGIGDVKRNDINFRVNVQGQERINKLREMLKQAGHNLPPINLRVNDNGSTSKISKIRNDVMSVAGKVHNVVVNVRTNGAEKLKGLKNNISEMATGAAMGMGAGMLGVAGVGMGAVSMVNTYKDFDYQMMRNKALFTTGLDAETAAKQYQELTDAARHYGSIMKFTASEVGKAEEYMALAGWDAPTAIKALPAVLNAAVASGEDLALVSDIITDDMTAMGYKAGQTIKNAMGENVEAAQHFADVMLRTTLRSNTNFQQLGLAMKYAAPLAHTLGYNIEEVSVALGLMANNGIKADQAGTGLRGILNRLIKPPKQTAESLERLGVSLFDAQGNAKGLMPALMDIRAAMKGENVDSMIDFAEAITGEQIENREEITDFLKEAKARGGGQISAQDRAKLGGMLSGTYALSAFMAIMNSTDEDIQKLMTEIYQKSDGTGADVAKEMANTLQGDLDTFKSAWEDLNIEMLSGGGGDGLRSFVQGLTDDINQFKTSLKDGLDFSDITSLGVKVLSQLKNKFLEMNGIGSALAGGALFMAMRKILQMGLRVKDTIGDLAKIRTMSDLGGAIRGTPAGAMGASVGTMHVSAGVVNLNGAVRGMPSAGTPTNQRGGIITPTNNRPPTTGGVISSTSGATSRGGIAAAGAATAGSILLSNRSGSVISTYDPATRQQNIANRNSAYVNDYYQRRGNILASTPSPIPPSTAPTGAMGTVKASAGAIGGGMALAGLFALMDLYSTRQHSESTSLEAAETLQYHKSVLTNLQEQGASSDRIAAQMQEVQDAQAFVDRTKTMNANIERQAEYGAAGMVAGTAIGGLIGSLVPVVGTAVGGMIGGVLGQWAGSKFAGMASNGRDEMRQSYLERQNRHINSDTVQFKSGGATGEFSKPQKEFFTASEYKPGLEYKPFEIKSDEDIAVEKFNQARKWRADYVAEKESKMALNRKLLGMSRGENVSDLSTPTPLTEEERYDARFLADLRDRTNEKWQMQFGGTSLAGTAKFTPDNERDRQLLARYDAEQAEMKLQQSRLEGIKAAEDAQKNSNQSIAAGIEQQKSANESFNDWQKQQNQAVQKSAFDAYTKSSQASKGLFSSIGDFFESVLFNKAAASSLRPETNMELSAPVQNNAALEAFNRGLASAQTPAPATDLATQARERFNQGLASAEPPDVNKQINDAFANADLSNFNAKFGEMLGTIDLSSFGAKFSEMLGNVDLANFGTKFGEMLGNIDLSSFGTKFGEMLGNVDLANFGTKFSEMFGNVDLANFSTKFGEMLGTIDLSSFGTKFSEMFGNMDLSSFSTKIDEMFTRMDLGAKFGEMFSGIELPDLGIGEHFSAELEGATAVFESFNSTVTATFSGLASGISGTLSGVGTAITTVFSSAASEVQGIWGAMPGFFSGVFGGLGGAAAAAGAAIAAGLTSGIGTVIGAWSAAAAQISSIISSISAQAASISVPSVGGVAGHAKGTSYFEGGFTEINEHGGEILNLPKGTQIIPHATTVNILKKEIRQSISSGATDYHGLKFTDYGLTNNILGGDMIYKMPKTKPNREAKTGTRWNMKKRNPITDIIFQQGGAWGGLLSDIFGGLLGGSERNDTPLGGGGLNSGIIPIFGGIFGDSDERNTPLSGDVITKMPSAKPSGDVQVGTRWNMPKSNPLDGVFQQAGVWGGLLTDIFGGIFGGSRKSGTPLGGGGIFSGSIPIIGGDFGRLLSPIMNFGGDLPMTSQPFSDDFSSAPKLDNSLDFELPKIKMPQVAESSSNSTSNSNSFNFGDVNINNGADFDEFVFRLQKLMTGAAGNSIYA